MYVLFLLTTKIEYFTLSFGSLTIASIDVSLLNQLFVGWNAQVLPKRRHWFRRLVQWTQRDTSKPEFNLGLIGQEQTGSMLEKKHLSLNYISHNCCASFKVKVNTIIYLYDTEKGKSFPFYHQFLILILWNIEFPLCQWVLSMKYGSKTHPVPKGKWGFNWQVKWKISWSKISLELLQH